MATFETGIEALVGPTSIDFDRDDSFALIAPTLNSSSRRWPLARSGASFEIEAQGVTASRGSCEMKSVGEAGAEQVAAKDFHF